MPKAKKTSAKKKPTKRTKAAFVRSLPAKTPAKEVVVKAKAAGVSLSEDYVYKTRSLDNARGKKVQKKATKTSASPKARGRAPDKRDRVLEVVAANPSWNADEVAREAKASTAYVYSVWKKKPKVAGTKVARTSSDGAVTDFYRVLKRVGVARAKELIANVEAFQNA